MRRPKKTFKQLCQPQLLLFTIFASIYNVTNNYIERNELGIGSAVSRVGFWQREALGYFINATLVINNQTYLCVYKGLDVRFPEKE